MVSFTSLVTAALALVPSAIAAPAGLGPEKYLEANARSLSTRQNAPWQWWTEGSGQFSCQQQGGGKYTCNWSGQPGGGMVAGSGWRAGRKYVHFIHPSNIMS
jgi:endo-1,4-beta-xylanase